MFSLIFLALALSAPAVQGSCDATTGFCSTFLSKGKIRSGMWTHVLSIILPTVPDPTVVSCEDFKNPPLPVTSFLPESDIVLSPELSVNPLAGPICKSIQPLLNAVANAELRVKQKLQTFLQQYKEVAEAVSHKYSESKSRERRGLFDGLFHLFGGATTSDIDGLNQAVQASTKLAKDNEQAIKAIGGKLISYEAREERITIGLQKEIKGLKAATATALTTLGDRFHDLIGEVGDLSTKMDNANQALGITTQVLSLLNIQIVKLVNMESTVDSLISSLTTLLDSRLDLRLIPSSALIHSFQTLEQSITDSAKGVSLALSTDEMLDLYQEARAYPTLHEGVVIILIQVPTVDVNLGDFNVYSIQALPISIPLEDLPESQISPENKFITSSIHAGKSLSAKYDLGGSYLIYNPQSGTYALSDSPVGTTRLSIPLVLNARSKPSCALSLLRKEDHVITSKVCRKTLSITDQPTAILLPDQSWLVTSSHDLEEYCTGSFNKLGNQYGARVRIGCGCGLRFGDSGQTPVSVSGCDPTGKPERILPVMFSIWASPNLTSNELNAAWSALLARPGSHKTSFLTTNLASDFRKETEHLVRSEDRAIHVDNQKDVEDKKEIQKDLLKDQLEIDETIDRINGLLPDISIKATKVITGLITVCYGIAICACVICIFIIFMRLRALMLALALVQAGTQIGGQGLSIPTGNSTMLSQGPFQIFIYPPQIATEPVSTPNFGLLLAISLLSGLLGSLIIGVAWATKDWISRKISRANRGSYLPVLSLQELETEVQRHQETNASLPAPGLGSYSSVRTSNSSPALPTRSCCVVYVFVKLIALGWIPLKLKMIVGRLPKKFKPLRLTTLGGAPNWQATIKEKMGTQKMKFEPANKDFKLLITGEGTGNERPSVSIENLKILTDLPKKYPVTFSIEEIAYRIECGKHENLILWTSNATPYQGAIASAPSVYPLEALDQFRSFVPKEYSSPPEILH